VSHIIAILFEEGEQFRLTALRHVDRVYGFQLAATKASPAQQRKAILRYASWLETIGSSAKRYGLARCLCGVLECVEKVVGIDTGIAVLYAASHRVSSAFAQVLFGSRVLYSTMSIGFIML
jgi:hypothetical protein